MSTCRLNKKSKALPEGVWSKSLLEDSTFRIHCFGNQSKSILHCRSLPGIVAYYKLVVTVIS